MILWYIGAMKICGIVCEYNPFHNGHIHHIKKTRELTECDLLVAVMSGNFVQRGEPAIVDKWTRSEAALKHGVDLVIELPFIYATQSARFFAQGAMHLLKQTGCDCFCFGSESNDLNTLQEYAKIEIGKLDRKKAPVQSYELFYGSISPNDILGINYLKYCKDMQPYCIQRTNHYFDEEIVGPISSATSIRKAVKKQMGIKTATPMEIKNPIFLSDFYPAIQLLLLTLSPDYLKTLFLMDEGIENLLIKNAQYASFEEFMEHSVSKKYTRSRIQRTCIHLLNQTTKNEVNQLGLPDYVRVLGANEAGRKHLRKAVCPIASRFSQIPENYRNMEFKTAAVYASVLPNEMRQSFREREMGSPVFI